LVMEASLIVTLRLRLPIALVAVEVKL